MAVTFPDLNEPLTMLSSAVTTSRHFARALTAFGLLSLGGCITTVVTPEAETSAGQAMSQQVSEQIGLYDDPELTAYVRSVGERLTAGLVDSPYKFQFAVVDQFEPNAFASPGGFIYISRGLLSQMNSEDELACVLAHEISHVTQRHHVRQMGRSLGTGLLTLPGRAVGVVSDDLGNMINSPIEHAGKVYLSGYSRDQETEADEYGLRLAAKTGYDPEALAGALEGIERTLFLLTGEHHEANYMDTHPTTPQRVADIETTIAKLTYTTTAPIATRTQLYQHLDGIWWGPQNPQQGIFLEDRFLSTDMDFTIAFPSGWETINTPRFVGATETEKEGAYMALGANPGEFTPDGYAAALITRMRERGGIEPDQTRPLKIGEWPAHLVTYTDASGEEPVSMHYVFLATPRGSYTMMALGLDQFRPQMREAVMSMRPLTSAERASVTGIRLRTATIGPGETLESWTERLDSRWGPKFSASMNGLEEDHTGTGEVLKYAREERYQGQ
ncbi:hypothetical protein EY643_06045 [Halioglobus maricola]|uniref:Peptidase M48 domain-containing protein n=1 Tax=Halioglobus maricola TaxID=2601894 RepID=A0A5P9NHE3_9GAMM|nr:M48 family metallopeptidase [Halioglobus maricola]QFU75247.1 hypothetical protein EY643_06045 [Halioglobus maricola]